VDLLTRDSSSTGFSFGGSQRNVFSWLRVVCAAWRPAISSGGLLLPINVRLNTAKAVSIFCLRALQVEASVILELPDQKLGGSLFKSFSHGDFLNTPTRCSVKCL
jgi:hypothetical protein